MNWKYYNPKFEYENEFDDSGWPWVGHKFFAYDLIRQLKPKRIVELGTHRGTSFFSFCQAVKDGTLETEINAVDTWKGEKHAGFYSEAVWKEINQIREKYYKNLSIKLIRKTFDEAIFEFEDQSIDLLHIDGLHTYEAIKHDFDNWLPKLSKDGIILLHDTYVKKGDFGVFRFWEEIKNDFKDLEFYHSFGLGVLTGKKNKKINLLFKNKRLFRMHYSLINEEKKNNKIKSGLSLIEKQKNEVNFFRIKAKELEKEVKFVKSSKFWKARNVYIDLKGKVNFVFSNPKKFIKKRFDWVYYNIKNFYTSLREEGFVAALSRTFNYIRYGKGTRKINQIRSEKKIKAKWLFPNLKGKSQVAKVVRKTGNVEIPKQAPLISLIVLTRNGLNHLRRLFESLESETIYPNYEVIVVDNGSKDGSLEFMRNGKFRFPVKILENKDNVSFSAGCNQGARESNADYLVFINNDIQVTKGWLCQLFGCYMKNKNCVGSIGARLIYPAEKNFHFSNRIQHAGIKFNWDANFSFYRPYNYGVGDFVLEHDEVSIFPALTAALLFVPKDRFEEVGGFSEDYFYGYEDVDLGLKLTEKGYKNICCSDSVAFHWELGTQEKDKSEDIIKRRKRNIEIFTKKWNKYLKKEIDRDVFSSRHVYSDKIFTVALVVTEAGSNSRSGDYFTGLELARELERFGWNIKFQTYKGVGNWYKVDDDVDLLISLLDKYDISKIKTGNANLVKVAWIRNWFDRWVNRKYFKKFNLILSSSKTGAEYIKERAGKDSFVFPIATNVKNFSKKIELEDKYICDYSFTGHYWGHKRKIIDQLDPKNLKYNFGIFGKDWDEVEDLKKFNRGCVEYEKMPQVYAGTKIVLDDAEFPTEPWGSVNSRVFDALAAGKLVLTNGVLGAKETFEGRLPFFQSKEELNKLLTFYLENEDERHRKANELKNFVLENHTYEKRAAKLCEILREYLFNKKIAIKIPVPNWKEAERWGDYHFGLALRKYFERKGWDVVLQILPEWDDPCLDRDCSLVLVLRGLSGYKVRNGSLNFMWNISHPEDIPLDEYKQYDHVFIASNFWVEKLKGDLGENVSTMLQCTDPELFRIPDKNSEDKNYKHELLFVGNSRNEFRKSVKYSIENGLEVDVFGNLWEKIIPSAYIKGENIPNKELYKYYYSADIVLNDHWKDMAKKGFISNRIFDALACGGTVLTDYVNKLPSALIEKIFIYKNKNEFKYQVEKIKKLDSDYKRSNGLRNREYIIDRHSFEERVNRISDKYDEFIK